MYGITNEVKNKLMGLGIIPSLDILRTYGTTDVPLNEQQTLYTMFEGAFNADQAEYDRLVSRINIDGVVLLVVDGEVSRYVMDRFGCPMTNIEGITFPLGDGTAVVLIGMDSTINDLHHELIHVRQHQAGRFTVVNGKHGWDGVEVPYGMGENDKEIYQAAPWEVEAFAVSGGATPEQQQAYTMMVKTSSISFNDLLGK